MWSPSSILHNSVRKWIEIGAYTFLFTYSLFFFCFVCKWFSDLVIIVRICILNISHKRFNRIVWVLTVAKSFNMLFFFFKVFTAAVLNWNSTFKYCGHILKVLCLSMYYQFIVRNTNEINICFIEQIAILSPTHTIEKCC